MSEVSECPGADPWDLWHWGSWFEARLYIIFRNTRKRSPGDTVLSENNNWLDLSTLVCSLTANPGYYWSCSLLKLISDLTDVLIWIFQWLWRVMIYGGCAFSMGGAMLQQQKLSERGVSGCHSFPKVPLFVPSSNSWGQMLSDVLYHRTCLLFWEQKQVWMSFWICICNALSIRILHLSLPFASDLWKIWISKDYCEECCVMLMSLILSIIPKLSLSWQVSLNKCTLQLDPAKRINSMS